MFILTGEVYVNVRTMQRVRSVRFFVKEELDFVKVAVLERPGGWEDMERAAFEADFQREEEQPDPNFIEDDEVEFVA